MCVGAVQGGVDARRGGRRALRRGESRRRAALARRVRVGRRPRSSVRGPRLKGELARQGGEAQSGQNGGADPGELVAGEAAAERQFLAALDGDDEEAVEEAVGELGRGDVAQQLVFGDVPDDRDVRVAGADGVFLAIVCSVLPSHALRITGERVLPSRASTLRTCANSDSSTSRRLSRPSAGAPSPPSGSRTSQIRPSPEDSPEEMQRSVKARSTCSSRASTWSQDEPLRPLPDGPTRITNSLR